MGIYDEHARWYDAIYDAAGRDPRADVDTVLQVAADRGVNPRSLLDVACGTGRHAEEFSARLDHVVGVDLSDAMLAVARDRDCPASFARADLRDLSLGERFDLVTCLFSSIGHVADADELRQAMTAMADHVAPGGLLLVEAWLTPEQADRDGRRHGVLAEVDDAVVARLASSWIDGDALVVEFGWAVAGRAGCTTDVERFRMPLFTSQQYTEAVADAGLEPEWLHPSPGLTGRGLVVGRRAGSR